MNISWTHLCHKCSSRFQNVSGDVQGLRNKQTPISMKSDDRVDKNIPRYSQPIAAEPGCTRPRHGARLLWKHNRKQLMRAEQTHRWGKTGHFGPGEDRQEVIVSPSGAPSHTTRSAGWPSKWRIISWAVDTWEEEDDILTHCDTKDVTTPPVIPKKILTHPSSLWTDPSDFPTKRVACSLLSREREKISSPWWCLPESEWLLEEEPWPAGPLLQSSPPHPPHPSPLVVWVRKNTIRDIILNMCSWNSHLDCVLLFPHKHYEMSVTQRICEKEKDEGNLSFRLRTWLQLPGAAQRSTALFTPVGDDEFN